MRHFEVEPGFVAVDRPLYEATEHRIFPILKTVQFLLLTWLVSGSRFLQFYTVETMMYNTSIAISMLFVLSGYLTHLHFSSMIANSTVAMKEGYRQYTWLRVLVHLPMYVFAIVLASIKAVLDGNFSMKKTLLSLSLTSSLSTMYPLANSTKVSDIVLAPCPTLVIASALVFCWLVYPMYAKVMYKLEAVHGLRVGVCIFAILVVPMALAYATVNAPTSLTFSKNNQGIVEPYREMDTIWGAAVWYINPCFKLPLFLVGVEAAEIVKQLRWSYKSPSSLDVNLTDRSLAGRIFGMICGGLIDVAVVLFYCLLRHDVRKHRNENADLTIVQRVGSYVWDILGYSFLAEGYQEWITTAWANLMTPWSIILVLLASPPVKYSLINRILTLTPILDVLPGRSGLIMSFAYPLIYSNFSKDDQSGFEAGRGLAFLVVSLFVVSIPFYYYVYQPYQLWVISTKIPNNERPINNNNGTTPAPKAGELTMKYLEHSPSYDLMYPDEIEKECEVVNTLVKDIGGAGSCSWLYAVFVGIHYANNRNK